MKEPKVGETYYCVFNDKRNLPKIITVDKVGRKYFYSNLLKFDKDTFIEDNGQYRPSCRLYDDEQQYQIYLKAKQCWMQISDRLHIKMTDEEIIELYEKLKDR